MKKAALASLLIAVIGLIAVSACSKSDDYSVYDHTARPQQTESIGTPEPNTQIETAPPEVPQPTSEIVRTDAPQTPQAHESEAPAAEPTEPPQQQTAIPEEPTQEPEPTERVKLDAFSFADNDIVPVDLDYDGINETVSIVQDAQSGEMKLVIVADNEYEIGIDSNVSSLVCAYVADFCFGDDSAELIISYLKNDGSYSTSVVGSFSSDTPVSCASFDGWVESLNDDELRLCRAADVLGMRGISMLHTYNSANGSFVPLEKAWTVYSYGQYAVLASELRAVSYTESGEEELLLEAGSLIIPTETDFYSFIDFETDQGVRGRIPINYENGESFIYEGVELASLFEELPEL